jgi:uncharacterized protein YdaU (DUF1376 family)
MSDQPYMPLFVADFLGDTLHLSASEIGAYVLLLMAMWRNGGSVPNDDRDLARMTRTGRAWNKVKARLLPMLTVEGDRLTQKRLRLELVHVSNLRKKNSENAKARWGKNNKLADAVASVSDMPNECPQTQTQTHKEKVKEEGANAPVPLKANLAWQGRVIRLTAKDFDAWKSAYAALDLAAELIARDAWLAEQPPDIRRRWYGSTSKFLANRNMEAKAKGQAPPPRRSELAVALDELVEKARKHDEQLGIGDGTIVGLSANGRGSPDLSHAQGFDEPIDGSGEADPFELSAKH